jgi:hypothetical protein
MKLKSVTLHDVLFVSGRNFKQEISAGKVGNCEVTLDYDRAEKELTITYGETAVIIPSSNIRSMVVSAEERPAPKVELSSDLTKPKPITKFTPVKTTAQASTPQQHVMQGLGAGKVRD